jgi:hypothetical protein
MAAAWSLQSAVSDPPPKATRIQREEAVKRSTTYRNRLARHLALGFAIAAVAAPIAQAQTPIPPELSNRQFGPAGLPAVVIPDGLSGRQFGPTLAGGEIGQQPGTVPAELDGRQFGPSELPLATIPSDLSGRDFGPATFTTDIPVTVPVADGFDWRDAGVGAAVVAAVALMLGALGLLIGRRRHLAGA